jgi:ferritin-like metal-binding protein YciE
MPQLASDRLTIPAQFASPPLARVPLLVRCGGFKATRPAASYDGLESHGTRFAKLTHTSSLPNTRSTNMSLKNLDDLFMDVLKDTLDAERQITKALPKMAKAVESEELRAAFEEHLSVTETQIERLETIFKSMDKAARGKHCPGMEGLLKEGSELIEKEEPGPALDAALIAAAQKVEHYEIAAYGTLATYAKMLEMDDALELLVQSLEEEKQTDEALTGVASEINLLAEQQAE